MARGTKRRAGISRAERARLRYGWGFESGDFAWYDLDGDEPGRRPTDYLGYHWYRYRVRPLLNDPRARALTENKWICYRLLDSFGLPAPRTFGLYDRTYGTTWDLVRPLRTLPDLVAELTRLRPEGVVVKPNGGSQGRGVLVLDSIDVDSGRAVTGAGEKTTLEDALQGLDASRNGRSYPGYIVQELVRNHPLLDELAPYATNTVRVQTLLAGDGQVYVLGAGFRLARSGSMVDNFSAGGVSVAVDARTGRTGQGVTAKGAPPVSRHPDSGAELAGRQLPFWDEVLDLVHRGAGCFTGVRGIGWDIALSPTGPKVVEGNNNWALQFLQQQTGGYLADPAFRRWMTDAGVPLPSGNVLRGLVGRRVWPVLARLRR